MDIQEAHSILAEHLVDCRTRSYAELASWVWDGRVDTAEGVAHGWYNCQIEIQCFWDDKPDGHGRVLVLSVMDEALVLWFRLRTALSCACKGDFWENENPNAKNSHP